MKSAYELAMERLKAKDSPDRKELNEEQKTKIAQVNEKYTAKAAERQIFLQKQIAEAFDGWHMWVVESATRKHGLRQAVSRMRRSNMVAAFERWYSHTQESRHLVSAASRVVAKMQHVAYVGSFARWAEFCEEKRRLRRVTSRLTN